MYVGNSAQMLLKSILVYYRKRCHTVYRIKFCNAIETDTNKSYMF